jgi:CRP/FNR family cyclic AMP-dependent transcriptional regulator
MGHSTPGHFDVPFEDAIMRQPRPQAWPPYARSGQSGSERVGALLLTEPRPLQSGPPPMLQGLSDQEIGAVIAKGHRKVLYRGTSLFSQGSPHDGIYLIETGRMRVFYTAPSGREITLAYWHPGNFVGGPEVFGGGPHIWSGIAATNSSVLHLPAATLKSLIIQIPALAIGIIEGLAFKGKCYSAMAQMLGTRSVTERLAHLLLHLADLYGVPEDGGVAIAAAFTHADLAHMVGATRQWVTIGLKRFADQGVITTKKSDIVILRPDVLAKVRDGSAA